MTKNEMIGVRIVELFRLPKLRKESKLYGKAYYPTSWGSKTLEGLGACVQRIIKESDTSSPGLPKNESKEETSKLARL